MKQSFTAVLEKNSVLSGNFATEPYEVAWAEEALWFIRTLALSPGSQLQAKVQVSPDGLHWCDLDANSYTAAATGLISWKTSNFGGWLRLSGEVAGKEPEGAEGEAKVLIYLALKG